MKAVLIDGPMRGKLVDVKDPYAFVVPVLNPTPFGYAAVPTFSQVTYQLKRVRLFGEFFLTGSVKTPPSEYDAFELLASDLAKDAVRG